MEFAKDLMSALRDRVSPVAEGAGNTGFDWSGLHARLVAAHAARAELARSDSRAVLLNGGFADFALVGGSGTNSSQRVNPADSTDGKGPDGIDGSIAGHHEAGGRGQ